MALSAPWSAVSISQRAQSHGDSDYILLTVNAGQRVRWGDNEALCFAASAPYTLGSGLNRPEGCSSNWQSAGLQNRKLWVRVPPPLPTQEECS